MKRIIALMAAAFALAPLIAGAETLVLPKAAKEVRPRAFYGCSQFAGVPVIPEDIAVIGEQAFAQCSGLSGLLLLPASAQVDPTAFDGTGITLGRYDLRAVTASDGNGGGRC